MKMKMKNLSDKKNGMKKTIEYESRHSLGAIINNIGNGNNMRTWVLIVV